MNLSVKKIGKSTGPQCVQVYAVIAILIIISSFSAAFAENSKDRQAIDRPNIILIVADDMGVGDVSAFNDGLTKTPNIDRLVEEGVYFDQAYAASAVCAPSRASLFTGRYPHRTGVVSLSQTRYPELTSLNLNETTLADLFKHNGYATGMIGKWHLGERQKYLPLERGFMESVHFIGGPDVPENYFNYRLNIQGTYHEFDDRYLTEDLNQRAIDYVRKHREEPFFLHLAHYAPHRPLSAPKEVVKSYLDQGLGKKTATIYAMIEIMDRGIGRLVEELGKIGIAERTIVIFTSDNGPDPLTGERFNRHLRGNKYTIYEGGIHIPFLVYWPGTLDPGRREEIIHFNDVYPTLVELCHLENPSTKKLDGASFSPLLFNKQASYELPEHRFWQWNRGVPDFSHNAAMRDGKWKLVRPFITNRVTSGPSTKKARLYNLEEDPYEKEDVSDQNFMRYEEMRTLLRKWSRKMEYEWVRKLK